MAAPQQRPNDMMNFPAEYQAPQIVHIDQVRVPAGMSVPISNGYTAKPNTATVAPLPQLQEEVGFVQQQIL